MTRLLEEFDAADFRSAERILEAMRAPRPHRFWLSAGGPCDCDRVVRAIRAAFEANRETFINGDGDAIALKRSATAPSST